MEDIKLLGKIKEFLSGLPTCFGYGDGSGSGNGSGSDFGSGNSSSSGYYGYGYGYGDGDGYGDGSGSGYGYGCRFGYGYGYGYSGLLEIDGHKICLVDSVPTIFTSVKGNVAKGYILQSDLTMIPCFVVKGTVNGETVFAHGNDLHKAMAALTDKMFGDMPEEDRVAAFIQTHPDKDKAYSNKDLFDWHHRLTGSCEAGRIAFMKDNNLALNGKTTVKDFIRLTQNAYGGSIIQDLAHAYNEITK